MGKKTALEKNKSLRNLLSLAWCMAVHQSWVNEDLRKRLVWLKPKQTFSKKRIKKLKTRPTNSLSPFPAVSKTPFLLVI